MSRKKRSRLPQDDLATLKGADSSLRLPDWLQCAAPSEIFDGLGRRTSRLRSGKGGTL